MPEADMLKTEGNGLVSSTAAAALITEEVGRVVIVGGSCDEIVTDTDGLLRRKGECEPSKSDIAKPEPHATILERSNRE